MNNILSRWEDCQKVADDTADECSFCHVGFQTGDVSLLFGEVSVAPAVRFYCCPTCYARKAESEPLIPSATMVYVENQHRRLDFEQLPPTVQDHFAEALEIVDRIHQGVEEWVRKNQLVIPPEGAVS
jgi:hypothetical protein